MVPGAKEALECVPDDRRQDNVEGKMNNTATDNRTTTAQDAAVSQSIELNMLWTTETEVEATQLTRTACPNLLEVALHWMRFGLLSECHVGVARYSQTIGGVQCTVRTAKAFSTAYIQWLTTNAQAQKGVWIQPFLQQCLGRPDLRLTDVVVMPVEASVLLLPSVEQQQQQLMNASQQQQQYPVLKYERRAWGTSQQDIITFVTALLILSGGMCCSMCMLLCVLIRAYTKKRPK
jgi:hypothetical protein